MRILYRTVTLQGITYDGAGNFGDMGLSTWKADDANGPIDDQKFSVLLSADETTVFTFTTGKATNGQEATDCRIDVWEISDLTTAFFSKGERSIQDRHCRFPSFHSQAVDSDGTEHMILLMTEYYSIYNGAAPKAGFMRIYLKNNYEESVVKDEEVVF